ncbi:VRR-NUC domain-containing protein [Oceanobacter kriegii]|uniref:VRR-NUC domain-containing protein n=1 Tax=Oceanobacter kriegii TaxID=64972 RepID=UPI0003FBAF40|nr:VRR-NUC domain-containing protein [Oceanobacter kriegii]
MMIVMPNNPPATMPESPISSASEANATVELPPFYYLDNFDALLRDVIARYRDLLTDNEDRILTALQSLPDQARALFVRMHSRKGRVFRLSKLRYAELDGIDELAIQLAEAELIQRTTADSLAVTDWLGLFSKPELLAWLPEQVALPKGCKQWKRAALDGWIEEALLSGDIPQQPAEPLAVLLPAVEQAMALCQLLYFGNLRQSLTEFVLRDLGVYRYPDVDIDGAARAFQSRAQIERHLGYYQLMPEDPDALKSMSADALQALAKAYPRDASDAVLTRRVDRQLLNIARQLERLDETDAALSIYRQVRRHPSLERQIRILAKHQPDHAMALAESGWQSPVNEEEQRFLESFVPRLAKQLKQALPSWYSPPCLWQEQKTTLPEGSLQQLAEGASIEAVALHLLQSEQKSLPGEREGTGFYVENALFSSLFGLLFWDAVYAPIPGAFYHPFQVRPDDLYDESFVDSRQAVIQRILGSIKSGEWKHTLAEVTAAHAGTANPFVYWGFLQSAVEGGCLALALERISDDHWYAIFERMLGDLRRRKTGLPDLIWFDDEDGVELIEIKGPGDTLQANQKSWLGFFEQQGIPAKVWYLTRPTG